jgi:hypothetical protein
MLTGNWLSSLGRAFSSVRGGRKPSRRPSFLPRACCRIERLEHRTLLTNTAPVAVADSLTVHQEMQGYLSVTDNDFDPDMMDYISLVGVSNGAHGTTSISSGYVTYTPEVGYSGTDSFSYVIQDNNGATAIGTVNVTITPNQAPVAVDDSLTVHQEMQGYISVTDNDYDPDMMDCISLVSASNGAHGTTSLSSGYVTYTPAMGYAGTDSFTYVIQDNHGLTATGTVNVTITPNQAPVAVDDSLTVHQENSGSVSVTDNDYDPDMMDYISVTSASNGAHGTTSFNYGQVTYTPDVGFRAPIRSRTRLPTITARRRRRRSTSQSRRTRRRSRWTMLGP